MKRQHLYLGIAAIALLAGVIFTLLIVGQQAVENVGFSGVVTANIRVTPIPISTPIALFGPIDPDIIPVLEGTLGSRPFAVLPDVPPVGAHLPGVKARDASVLVLANSTALPTPLPSATNSPTSTFTPTTTPSSTLTETNTSTSTSTNTVPATPTPTTPPTLTVASSATETQTLESSATLTYTITPTPTSTPSLAPTSTQTRTPIIDLGIVVIPTTTVHSSSPTRSDDLGILPTATFTRTRTPRPTNPRPTAAPGTKPSETPIQPTNTPPPLPGIGGCSPRGLPVHGFLTQRYHRWHSGVDLSVPLGTPVIATHSGQVTYAGWSSIGYGWLVVVQNGPFITYYAHNSSLKVEVSQNIQAGAVLALSGRSGRASGPHVHYETRIDNIPVDPLTFDKRQLATC
jgi:murein DD-endopeptidase MepM/ murein hydrolase activator NlpD